MSEKHREWSMILTTCLALMVFSHLVFGRFYPGPNGVGHDYSAVLTGALADYYWAISESNWIPPWFTPAFCGGIPLYADPQSSYFALPSLLIRFLGINPLLSYYLTFLVLVGAGFLGMAAFVRNRLGASAGAALLAGVLFGLNGFFSSRMMIGHTAYHGVMLIPWLALCLTSRKETGPFNVGSASKAVTPAFLLSYWVYSGASALLIAFALATIALVFVAWIRQCSIRQTMSIGIPATALALLISGSKINAVLAYMQSFPRSGYLLPGYIGVPETVQVLFKALFTNPDKVAQFSAERLTNLQWFLDRHELEFGVTVIPLALLVAAILVSLFRSESAPTGRERPVWTVVMIWVGLTFTLAVPIAINTYDEAWNALLKSLPIIGSSSSLIRWFVIYVPITAMLGGMSVDWIMKEERQALIFSAVAAVGVGVIVASTNRDYYAAQPYDPSPVIEAFDSARKEPSSRPSIRFVGAIVDSNGNIQLSMNRQDLLTRGISQLACYVPIFGYRLEFFPFKSLRPGSIFDVGPDGFNMKNPACFVFPQENACAVGDHFDVSRRDDLAKFADYRSFPFKKSIRQKVLDYASLIALLLSMMLLCWAALRHISRQRTD